MFEFRSVHGRGALEGAVAGAPGRRGIIGRSVALASRAAERPYASTAGILAANLLLIGIFIVGGDLLFADPAEFFRELMPGTWLSVAQLGFVAAAAWAIHRELIDAPRPRLDNLWGVSVAVFIVFAVDEATQLTIFLSDGLTAAGALAPAGFKDLDAFLLTVLLLAGGAAVLRYGRTLLSYPAALPLLGIGVALGVASQTLDSVFASTSPEFVAEESLKLTAEAFLIGGYLLILNRVSRR